MKNDGRHILREAKLKVTPARLHLLSIFSDKCKPWSAEDLIYKLKKTSIDKVTIYRNLGALEQAGIINRVNLRKDAAYFELARHHHHHFVCTACGELEKLPNCQLGKIVKKSLAQSKKFAAVKTHSFELFGLCKACAKN